MVRNMNIEKNAAPVAVFVYNRLEHTKRLFESLKKNKYADYSDVYIFSDGAKSSKDQSVYNKNKIQVAQVRDYISKIKGFKNVYITYREKNYGLAKNIISGVTDVLTKSNKIIVLEDDLVVSSAFLVYMNLALDRYEHEERVYSVSGYSYINKRFIKNRMPETFFLPVTCSWAWGTWKSCWLQFDFKAEGWQSVFDSRMERKRFDFGDSVDYSIMLKEQMENDIDSWAVRWYWTVYKNNGLTLYPLHSYADNRGFDGSGIHTKDRKPGGMQLSLNEKERVRFPKQLCADKGTLKASKMSLSGGRVRRNFYKIRSAAAWAVKRLLLLR